MNASERTLLNIKSRRLREIKAQLPDFFDVQ
jgi:hypothetical protein